MLINMFYNNTSYNIMKYKKLKQLSFGLHQTGGRTKHGPITSPRRGALIKKIYRFLDTKRKISMNINGGIILQHYIYDPNRTGFISLVSTTNGIITYILAADYSMDQERIYNLQEPPIKKERGWSNYLKKITLGTILYNIEFFPGNGGQIARAAGNFAVLLKKEQNKKRVVLKLKSGELRLVSQKCTGVTGITSNQKHFLRNYKKAGTTRHLGIRPRVRPSSMNPVDHPMGGRTRGGCAPQNKNGKLNKKNKKKNNFKIAYL